jgi:hypothetical protein
VRLLVASNISSFVLSLKDASVILLSTRFSVTNLLPVNKESKYGTLSISFTRKRKQKDNSNDYKANCTISPSLLLS